MSSSFFDYLGVISWRKDFQPDWDAITADAKLIETDDQQYSPQDEFTTNILDGIDELKRLMAPEGYSRSTMLIQAGPMWVLLYDTEDMSGLDALASGEHELLYQHGFYK